MEWTELHGTLLGRACDGLLGRPEPGAMAFVRCLAPEVVAALAADEKFAPAGWRVLRVADTEDESNRTTDADTAVELRETKGDATLLLVDTGRAGAGMDGIYNAAREVNETALFAGARQLASATIASGHRAYAERAIRRAQGVGRHDSVSPWVEFDFLCRVAAHRRHPGEYLHLLGLWTVKASDDRDTVEELAASRRFMDRLLGVAAARLTVPARIAIAPDRGDRRAAPRSREVSGGSCSQTVARRPAGARRPAAPVGRVPAGPPARRHPVHRTHLVAQPQRENRQVVGIGGTVRGGGAGSSS